MAESTPTEDLDVFKEVQRVIDGLIKFDVDSRMRIYRTVGAFFGFDDVMPTSGRQADSPTNSREPHFSTDDPSPKDFVFEKQPNSDVQRVACLAYYLANYRNTPHFKTTDISKLNTEAAQIKLSNASAAISNAIRAGLLVAATRGMRQLSPWGEKYVEALPDHAAAKALGSAKQKRRPRRKSGRNGAGGPEKDAL